RSVYDIAGQLREALAGDAETGFVAFGEEGRLLLAPGARGPLPEPAQAQALMEEIGSSSNFERAVHLARGLFPGGSARHLVIVGDGVETRGSLLAAAAEAAVSGVKIHAIGVTGTI